MGDDVFERIRQRPGANSKSGVRPEDVEHLKQAASSVTVPTVVVSQRAWAPIIAVPDIKPLSGDRRDRNAAKELRRELGRIAAHATRAGVAMQAARAVNSYIVYSADKGQEEMMDLLYSKTRYEGMNELVASVISQSLQQMVAQMIAISEQHFKRQMEEL